MLAHMVARGALFVAWAVVGAVASYGAPSVLTGYGLMILGTCLFAGLALPELGGRRWPEILGLLAGPGVFCVYAGALSADRGLILAGVAFTGVSLAAYALAGRARCARGRPPTAPRT
jgi:hypothetical protein